MTLDEIEEAVTATIGLKAAQQGPEEEAAKERAMIAGVCLAINIARSPERIARQSEYITSSLQSLEAQHGAH